MMPEITKASVTRTHFLIPFFSVRVNSEESTPCTLFLLSLKFQLLEQHIRGFENSEVEIVTKIQAFETSEKVNGYTKSSFSPSLQPGPQPVFPTRGIAAVTQYASSGQGTARFLSATLRVRRE
jgi:hypothetical protein